MTEPTPEPWHPTPGALATDHYGLPVTIVGRYPKLPDKWVVSIDDEDPGDDLDVYSTHELTPRAR